MPLDRRLPRVFALPSGTLPRTAALRLVAVLGVVLTACAPMPDIAARSAAPGPDPVLVPLQGVLAQADAIGTGAQVAGPVSARADRLRARADRLRRQ